MALIASNDAGHRRDGPAARTQDEEPATQAEGVFLLGTGSIADNLRRLERARDGSRLPRKSTPARPRWGLSTPVMASKRARDET